MFGGQDEAFDDPGLHEGRIRSFAHERGNWASLVYIPCVYFIVLHFFLFCCSGCICLEVLLKLHQVIGLVIIMCCHSHIIVTPEKLKILVEAVFSIFL